MSGFNLPDGTYEGDPRAPWNRREPWEGHICAECRYCGKVYDKADSNGKYEVVGNCCSWIAAYETRDLDVWLIDPDTEACEQFEVI